MASDTFVYWNEERPTKDDLHACLQDYLAEIATEIRWDRDRFFVTLVGRPSFPFARVGPSTPAMRQAELERAVGADGTPRPRWFEVVIDSESIDVITRQADEITMNIARSFAALCARAWDGGLDKS